MKSTRGLMHRRRASSGVMIVATTLAATAAILPMIAILWHIVNAGVAAVDIDLLTKMPAPVGESGGGIANAIVGTLILIAGASMVGLPLGVGAGLYLAERRETRTASTVRFLADILNGVPSIVIGIFAWGLLVRPIGHFSAMAGAIALGVMMLPAVARTTEEMVLLVPPALREAALALGYPRWRASLTVVLRTAAGGVITGALVAVARIAGETAPLLFTAFGNQFWSTSLDGPIAALPLQIFTYALSPYDEWHTKAWAATLVLVAIVLAINVLARVAGPKRHRHGD